MLRGWRESNVGHCTDPQLAWQRTCGGCLPHAPPPCCHSHSHRGEMCVLLKWELPCSPRERGLARGEMAQPLHHQRSPDLSPFLSLYKFLPRNPDPTLLCGPAQPSRCKSSASPSARKDGRSLHGSQNWQAAEVWTAF